MIKYRGIFTLCRATLAARPALPSGGRLPLLPSTGRLANLRCLSLTAERRHAATPSRLRSDAHQSSAEREPAPGEGDDSSRQGHHQEQTQERAAQEDRLKERILEASMPYVGDLGWSTEALAAGADSLGLSDVAHGMFPAGGVQLVHHFYSSCNRQLSQLMAERRRLEQQPDGPERLGSQAFIRWAVERRLRMVAPLVGRWPEAMALLSLPSNAAAALSNLAALVDDIWYHAGDRSSDFNWYTKRALLAAVYKATELRLLTDSSEDFSETWAFLDRRLEDAVTAGRAVRGLREAAPRAANTASVAASTVCGMLGLKVGR